MLTIVTVDWPLRLDGMLEFGRICDSLSSNFESRANPAKDVAGSGRISSAKMSGHAVMNTLMNSDLPKELQISIGVS